MAAYSMIKNACENAKNSLFFNLAGDNVKWKTVSLFHVEYPEGDLLGRALAWFSLMPMFLIVGFITLIVFRRELHTITFFVGLLLGEVVNIILKSLLAQFRPCSNHVFAPSSYGMPSDHSQFMAFFSLYSVCFIYGRLHYAQSTTFWDDLMDNLWRHAVALGVILLALIVAFSRHSGALLWNDLPKEMKNLNTLSRFRKEIHKYIFKSDSLTAIMKNSYRVYLQYHTLPQVLCGLAVGSVWAILWFMFTQTVLTAVFPIIITWPVSEYLMIRDSTLIPSVMWFEYTVSRAEMRKRQRRGSHNSYCKSHTS